MSTDSSISSSTCCPNIFEKTGWSKEELFFGIAFATSVIATNILFLTFRSSLNIHTLSTLRGGSLFIFPPSFAVLNGIIFFALRHYRKNGEPFKLDLVLELPEERRLMPRWAPALDGNQEGVQVEIAEDREANPSIQNRVINITIEREVPHSLPSIPSSHMPVIEEVVKENKLEVVNRNPVATKRTYTDLNVLNDFAKPIVERFFLLLQAILVANYSAENPDARPSKIKSKVSSELKTIEKIGLSLWNILSDHVEDMKFVQDSFEQEKKKTRDAISPVSKTFIQNENLKKEFEELLRHRSENSNPGTLAQLVVSFLNKMGKAHSEFEGFFGQLSKWAATYSDLGFSNIFRGIQAHRSRAIHTATSVIDNAQDLGKAISLDEALEKLFFFYPDLDSRPFEQLKKLLEKQEVAPSVELSHEIHIKKEEVKAFLSDLAEKPYTIPDSVFQSFFIDFIQACRQESDNFETFLHMFFNEAKKDRKTFAHFRKLFELLNEPADSTANFEKIKELVANLKEVCKRAVKDGQEQRFYLILIQTISAIHKDKIHERVAGFLRYEQIAALKDRLNTSSETEKAIREVDSLYNYHAKDFPELAEKLLLLKEALSKLKASQEMTTQEELQKNFTDAKKALDTSLSRLKWQWKALNECLNAKSRDTQLLQALRGHPLEDKIEKVFSRFSETESDIENSNPEENEDIQEFGITNTSFVEASNAEKDLEVLLSELQKDIQSELQKLERCNTDWKSFIEAKEALEPLLVNNFPFLSNRVGSVLNSLKALEQTQTSSSAKEKKKQLEHGKKAVMSLIRKAEETARYSIPDPLLESFFARFMQECLSDSRDFILQEGTTHFFKESAKFMSQPKLKQLLQDQLGAMDFDEYLFGIRLFQPILSIFFDTKSTELENLTGLHIQDRRIKKIVQFDSHDAPSDEFLEQLSSQKESLREASESEKSKKELQEIEQKEKTRKLILKQLLLLADQFSAQFKMKVKLVEKDPKDTNSEDPLFLQLAKSFPNELKDLLANYRKLGLDRAIAVVKEEGDFELEQFIFENEVSLSLQLNMGITIKQIPFQPLEKLNFETLCSMYGTRRIDLKGAQEAIEAHKKQESELDAQSYKKELERLQKDLKLQKEALEEFTETCEKANGILRQSKQIKKLEEKLNAPKVQPVEVEQEMEAAPIASIAPMMLYAFPVPPTKADNPLIAIKPYQGGKLAGLLKGALYIMNATKTLKGIINFAEWVIEKISHKKQEIPVLNGFPGLNDKQNEVIIDSACTLIYLFDILVYDLVLSKGNPAKNAAKKLLDGGLYKALTEKLPAVLQGELTPEALLKGFNDFMDIIMDDLDPHRIRDFTFAR